MNLSIRYAAFLSLLLSIMFIVGNPSFGPVNNSSPGAIPNPGNSTLQVFPSSLATVAIALVIVVFIVHRAQRVGTGFTWAIGFRSGELVSRYSATFFTVAVVMYGLGFYSGRLYSITHAAPLVLWSGLAAFAVTYLLGLAFTALVTMVVLKMRVGTKTI